VLVGSLPAQAAARGAVTEEFADGGVITTRFSTLPAAVHEYTADVSDGVSEGGQVFVWLLRKRAGHRGYARVYQWMWDTKDPHVVGVPIGSWRHLAVWQSAWHGDHSFGWKVLHVRALRYTVRLDSVDSKSWIDRHGAIHTHRRYVWSVDGVPRCVNRHSTRCVWNTSRGRSYLRTRTHKYYLVR
jgi:hypothetical protein